jgi:AcrR family transcriptional regulator
MARKSKLNQDLIAKVVKLIETGNYANVVARSVGVSEATFYRWLAEGEDASDGLKREFFEAVTRARATAEINAVKSFRSAFDEDWRSVAEFLSRRYPQRWAKNRVPEPHPIGQPPPKLDLTLLSDDQLDNYLDILRTATRDGGKGGPPEGQDQSADKG